ETDSAAAGTEFQFQAVHFSWYNRHATRGDDVPQDVHPMLLGKKDLRTNYSQMLPYTSKDMLEHADTYHNLQVVFDNVFTWVAEQVQTTLPDEYRVLSMDAQVLPGNAHSIVHPFLSLVINLNVATMAHRDRKDKSLCVVL
ncbi:uncharacterized protein B0H18DRAFT_824077, partial [Fomitopsis serialis]|uniref:uncharacterized protein n=1 Tax=Fomitopsis serialis TaxID=139415 RepID=UPI002007974C